MGYAPASREALQDQAPARGIRRRTRSRRTGLVVEREGGMLIDRFRNRLMIPIARDNGTIIAFGGRAMEDGQVPKYLNSPETAIYVKGRTLYGLHLSKAAIVKAKHAVMVEGYFDVAQALQGGIPNVVASSGTALTPAQARLLKRFAPKVVLSFDPDAAGKGAAVRSSELLVAEGFQVNVAMMPAGRGPRHVHPPRRRRRLRRKAAVVAALPRVPARSGRGRTGSAAGRGPAGVPERACSRSRRGSRTPPPVTSLPTGWPTRRRITEEVVRAEIKKAAAKRETAVAVLDRPDVGAGPGQNRRKRPDLGPDARPGGGRRGPGGARTRRIWTGWRPSRSSSRRGPCRNGRRTPYRRRFSSV